MDLKSLIPFGTRPSGLARSGVDDPFLNLRREMDRMFESFTRDWPFPTALGGEQGGFLSPRVNVAETETGLELTAELPGVDEKDIDIDLTDGVLTLKAEQRSEREEKDEKKRYHLVERSYGTFMRRFALPFEPDEDKVEASFDKGILRIAVPRSADADKQGRKIAVKASGQVSGEGSGQA